MWAHKEGSQPEHKAIEHGEIRRTPSGAIADQELMFEQERFSCDLARAARAEEFREGHEQWRIGNFGINRRCGAVLLDWPA